MGDWLKNCYRIAKNAVKDSYNFGKKSIKSALDFVDITPDTKTYKALSKVSHVTEPIASGVVETIEFVAKNPKETGAVLCDLGNFAFGGDKLDSKRLLNYLYNYSKETGADVKQLLKELPPETLSASLKYINNEISDYKKIPCSKVCMDIALSNPKHIKSDEYRTVEESTIDRIISGFEDELTSSQKQRLKENMPLIMFKADGMHARMLQENATMIEELKKWSHLPEKDRKHNLCVTLNANSDPKNGYDSYATFHNVNIINPQIDENGNITAYVYDIYDFERASFNGQMLDFATIMAYHLQETGHIQNYKMLIPITIPASQLNM